MKEFVEKLNGRLEEYKYSHLVEHNRERLEHCTENESKEHCHSIDCFWCVWDKSKEIINQLAEEYNNGWIPVTERLPKENEFVIASVHPNESVNGGNPVIITRYDSVSASYWHNGTIQAWMPLPVPYQKGE